MNIAVGTKLKCLNDEYTTCKKNKKYEVIDIIYKNGYTFFSITDNKEIWELISNEDLNNFEVIK